MNNGSVTGAPCANSGINGGNAAGWSGCGFSPDLCCLTMPSYVATSSVTPVVSPDGGTWLGLAALGECAQTTITGLTAGNTYTLYFCGACFGTGTSIYNQGPARPRITVGASVVTFTIPMAASTWSGYSMTFLASAATMTLRCDHPTGSVSYASLDGFRLATPICTVGLLPIELVSFGAEFSKAKKSTELRWTTSMEENVNKFVIQKSKNAYDFVNVAEVSPGQQPSSGQRNYKAMDVNTGDKGIVYYRLMTLDHDGSKSYSDLIDVDVTDSKDDFKIYPNPTANTAIMSYYSEVGGTWTVSIYGDMGKFEKEITVNASETGINKLRLDLSDMSCGLYFVRIANETIAYKTSFVKE